ncbi:phage head-tail adapter protein [Sphingobium yanoikuyae]|uniref:phage head completion protein n=1 Tax=Sphingobium yanoikuyae TaxID=13690 RepID=UPI0007A75D67|nr:head-tail adaptor protein [Sphingobium yanoikuyae]KZC82889.1 phage head-tail adapter protein [Sphingobium yanoikuyae]
MGRRSAGEFDRRISIWNAGLIDDGTATVQGPLAEVGKRWAKKVDVKDGERLRAGENAQELTTRFTVRSDALTRTIIGGFVIKHKGVTYAVTGTKEGREREDVIEITTAARPDRPKEA